MAALKLEPEDVKDHHCVCSRHFINGDTSNPPSLSLGRKFRSPRKMSTPRGQRARKRQKLSLSPTPISPSPSPVPSVDSAQVLSDFTTDDDVILEREQMTTSESEILVTDCIVIDLPQQPGCSRPQSNCLGDVSSVIVNKALLARIEALEAELKQCQIKQQKQEPSVFCIENIAANDSLIHFYTGFPSYEVFLCFFEFLGPAVHCLNYWGDKGAKTKRKKKLDPKNQLLLTLMKLRQNPKERDLAFRFGVSVSTMSKYFIT